MSDLDAFCEESWGGRGGGVAGESADGIGAREDGVGEDVGDYGGALVACGAEDGEDFFWACWMREWGGEDEARGGGYGDGDRGRFIGETYVIFLVRDLSVCTLRTSILTHASLRAYRTCRNSSKS